ncbi:MAG: Na+/H+ antiporter NhaC [Paraglaciecola sp.]|jgi:Na+/H+ antiporter NhaC
MLAISVGGLNQDVGGGLFLMDLLGERVLYWILPVMLQLLTMIIAFSTGTSWGTYAIAFPLAMPPAWSIGLAEQVVHSDVFIVIF